MIRASSIRIWGPWAPSSPDFNVRRHWDLESDHPDLFRLLIKWLEIVVEKQITKDHLELVRHKEAARTILVSAVAINDESNIPSMSSMSKG